MVVYRILIQEGIVGVTVLLACPPSIMRHPRQKRQEPGLYINGKAHIIETS